MPCATPHALPVSIPVFASPAALATTWALVSTELSVRRVQLVVRVAQVRRCVRPVPMAIS